MDPVFKEALAMTQEAVKAQVDSLEAGSKLGASTPGPWWVGADISSPGYRPIHSAQWGGLAEVCAGCSDDDGPPSIFVKEGAANARLIAAAPELAEVLRRFLEVLDRGSPLMLIQLVAECGEDARALLKKLDTGTESASEAAAS